MVRPPNIRQIDSVWDRSSRKDTTSGYEVRLNLRYGDLPDKKPRAASGDDQKKKLAAAIQRQDKDEAWRIYQDILRQYLKDYEYNSDKITSIISDFRERWNRQWEIGALSFPEEMISSFISNKNKNKKEKKNAKKSYGLEIFDFKVFDPNERIIYERSVELKKDILYDIVLPKIDTVFLLSLPVDERVEAFDKYLRDHVTKDGVGLFGLFPEFQSLAKGSNARAPKRRPEVPKAVVSWVNDREPGDTPVTFIQRHYQGELDKNELDMATLRKMDWQLARVLTKWLKANEPPPGFSVPTHREKNDLWIKRISSGEEQLNPANALRFGSALQRRARSQSDGRK